MVVLEELPCDVPFHELVVDTKFHPYVTLRFGEITATAVWDTGASITVADMSFINTYPTLFQEVGKSQGTDAIGANMETPLFIMASPMIGRHEFSPHTVAGVDLSHVNAHAELPMDLILGYTTLRQAHWVFDFPLMSATVGGIERAIFGEVTADDITAWLNQYVHRRLSLGVQTVLFRAGRLAAVYGLQLTNGLAIVAKVYRGANIERLATAVSCQRFLADAHYPCPAPLETPGEVDGRIVLLETLLDRGEQGDAHSAVTRRAMAQALLKQIRILRSVPELRSGLLTPPAWAAYDHGPWPIPHDPIFDFTTTPVGFEWLDHLAQLAAEALGPRRPPDALGHSDWVCQNLRFNEGGVCAAYDWDSLLAESEPVLVGVVAGAYTEGSIAGAAAPTPEEVVAFLSDYEANRHAPFSKSDQVAAAAAATWVLAYNARCDLSAETFGYPAREGSALKTLSRYGASYLALRW